MIGLFDSGFGGLTILHGLLDRLPQYSYLYLGDNARAPYGSRQRAEIVQYTQEGVAYLFEQGCSLVILACNTASAQALRELQRTWLPHHYPDRQLLGVVVPTIEQITGLPWKHVEPLEETTREAVTTVGILATEQTVASGAYEHEIHKRTSSIKVIQQACPHLVPLIERGSTPAVLLPIIHQYVAELRTKMGGGPPLQSVLLGCTHFALIVDLIRQALPPSVQLYEQPKIVARSLQAYLGSHPEVEQVLDRAGRRIFLTTGDAATASTRSQQFFGKPVIFTAVALEG